MEAFMVGEVFPLLPWLDHPPGDQSRSRLFQCIQMQPDFRNDVIVNKQDKILLLLRANRDS
jgi:hypothetical protein